MVDDFRGVYIKWGCESRDDRRYMWLGEFKISKSGFIVPIPDFDF